MTEAPTVQSPRGRATRLPASNGPGPAAAAERLAERESRRAWNRQQEGVVVDLRCECGAAGCLETFPIIAEVHRGIGERFIVVPAHADDGMVVMVADRFFVVELNGRAARFPPLPAPRKHRPSSGMTPIEVVAPDRHCAALLVEHAAPRFRAEIVSGAGWTVRLNPPAGKGWVPALLSLVERWLAAAPLPCAKVLYSGRTYLVRAQLPSLDTLMVTGEEL